MKLGLNCVHVKCFALAVTRGAAVVLHNNDDIKPAFAPDNSRVRINEGLGKGIDIGGRGYRGTRFPSWVYTRFLGLAKGQYVRTARAAYQLSECKLFQKSMNAPLAISNVWLRNSEKSDCGMARRFSALRALQTIRRNR